MWTGTRAVCPSSSGDELGSLPALPLLWSWVCAASGSYLNLLSNAILDKLVHLLAQVSNKGLGSQGASRLLTLLQLFLQ